MDEMTSYWANITSNDGVPSKEGLEDLKVSKEQQMLNALGNYFQKEFEKMQQDSVVYGRGYMVLDAKGLRHISQEEFEADMIERVQNMTGDRSSNGRIQSALAGMASEASAEVRGK